MNHGYIVIPVDGDKLQETFQVVRDALKAHWEKTGEQNTGPVYITYEAVERDVLDALVQKGKT